MATLLINIHFGFPFPFAEKDTDESQVGDCSVLTLSFLCPIPFFEYLKKNLFRKRPIHQMNWCQCFFVNLVDPSRKQSVKNLFVVQFMGKGGKCFMVFAFHSLHFCFLAFPGALFVGLPLLYWYLSGRCYLCLSWGRGREGDDPCACSLS